MPISTEMQVGLDALKQKMIADYNQFMPSSRGEIAEKMQKEYAETIRFEEGNSYIKVITGSSVHSFICKKNNDKKGFVEGDILKAASWNSPATNFTRGNVLVGMIDRVRWTGVI